MSAATRLNVAAGRVDADFRAGPVDVDREPLADQFVDRDLEDRDPIALIDGPERVDDLPERRARTGVEVCRLYGARRGVGDCDLDAGAVAERREDHGAIFAGSVLRVERKNLIAGRIGRWSKQRYGRDNRRQN